MNSVMVVEDEQLVAKDIADTLATLGYDVTDTVATGEACVECARSRRPDLVLMDIHLQGPMDGIEAAQRLRELDVPVVFLSAYADNKTVTRAKQTGPLGYLLKPFRRSELKTAVEVGLFRHQMEKKLRARERWFATTLRAIGDAVVAVDSEGRVSFMNGAAQALLGCSERGARGKPSSSLFQLLNERTREPVEDPIRLALERQEVVRIPPHTALVVAGRELPVEDSVAPIVDEHGERLGAVLVMRDMSAARKAHEHLAVADRLASLGKVAAGIAHEINNPLTYIIGNVGFLSDGINRLRARVAALPAGGAEPELRATLDDLATLVGEIGEGSARVSRIVADLGFFGRKELKRRRGNALAALEWALRVSHASIVHHARITRKLLPVPDVSGDEGRLGQVFLNILLNAAYAMSVGGPPDKELLVSTALDREGYVSISISDSGVGMTPEVMARIFDPFFTTKPVGAGTGLGLSVCHSAVEEMGGSIHVTSSPGKGSTFVVRLPMADDDVPAEPARSPASDLRARILVVDDDAHVLGALGRMLSPPHEVVTVDGGRAALARLEQTPPFDIVLCDLLMSGMNGMELYDELSRRAPELARRIIFLSGAGNTEFGAQFFSRVPNLVLMKPPTRVELLSAVQEQLVRWGYAELDLARDEASSHAGR